MAVEPGTIVLLNGTASSGKTSISRAPQDLMPDAWINAGIDRFLAMLPARYLERPLWADVMGLFDRPGEAGSVLISGMHHAVAALAGQGNSIVADHVMVDPAWVAECAASVLSAQRAAVAIRDLITGGTAPTAFRRLAPA